MTIAEETRAGMNATSQPGSLKDYIVAARSAELRAKTADFEVPGYGGRLWATLRGLDDYSEMRGVITANERVPDAATMELNIAADTLLLASVDCFGLRNGEKESLDVRLGLPLSQCLGMTDSETNRQAIFEVFPDTMSVMTMYAQYDNWLKGEGREADQRAEGKSGTPS